MRCFICFCFHYSFITSFQMGKSGTKKKPVPKDKNKALKKVNPFDLKFNRTKHNVLGKNKNQPVGKPMQSRKKGIEHREKTLAQEYKSVGKVNKLVDKRWGERDQNISVEEKASKRFTEERLTSMSKTNKFNLSEDVEEEMLTHGGHVLTSIEKYEKVEGSDDEDEGELGAELVSSAHFGGGSFNGGDKGKPRDRNDIIAEMIVRSKQVKMDKSNAKEEQLTATDNLDEKLKSLMKRGALEEKKKGEEKRQERDDYDDIYTTLKLSSDKRGKAVDAKMTAEEEAELERERLEKLENDRRMRMNTIVNTSHYSADDDSIMRKQERREKSSFEVKYDEDGKIIGADKVEKNSKRRIHLDYDSDDDMYDDEIEDEEEDLDELIDNDDDDDSEPLPKKSKTDKAYKKMTLDDLPFTFEFPQKYSNLMKLIDSMETECIPVLVERLMKCYHPSLKEGNKDLMDKLFLYLIRFFTDTSRLVPTKENISKIEILLIPLHNLLKLNRESSVKCIRSLIRSEWRSMGMKSSSSPPSFTIISTLRLSSILFPVTDVWHPVCTLVYILSTRALGVYQIRSLSVLGRQLLLLYSLSEMINDSHRFIPEAITFLRGCICLSVEGDIRVPSTAFPISLPLSKMLIVKQKVTSSLTPVSPEELFNIDKSKCLIDSPLNRCRILRIVISLVKKFMIIYTNHGSSFTSIFKPIHNLLLRIPLDNLPSDLSEDITDLSSSISVHSQQLSSLIHLGRAKTEQNMLSMIEPRFDEEFDPEHKYKSRKGPTATKKKFEHLIKKERRGAIKEIRKDNSFIAKKRAYEIASLDKDRKRKTKKLMSSLQSQEGEARRMEGQKKWKKR